MKDIIFLKPAFKEYLWGGTLLKEKFNKEVENKECTAESWEVSTNKDGESIIKNGEYRDKTLTEVFDLKERRKEIFGENAENLSEFPILIKFIDANKNLSVQVHPNDEYAKKIENSLGKTEMWYILDCAPNTKIIYGLNDGVTLEEFSKSMNSENITQYLNFVDVKKGDVIYIPSGTVHSILEGTLIAEVQQNSNITYRVYDWGRVGKDGKPRELHIKKALDVIDFGKTAEIKNSMNIEKNKSENIIKNSYFKTDKVIVENEFSEESNNKTFFAINVVSGNGIISTDNYEYEIKIGDSFIIPATLGKYKIKGNLEILKSYI